MLMWQSLVAISRGTSEIVRWTKKTSPVKHKPIRNYRSGRPNNFGASGSILTKLFQSTCRKTGDKMDTLFGSPSKKMGEQKHRPKFTAIFDNFRLSSRISSDMPQDRGDKMDTLFGSPPPKKKWESKNIVQNSPRFLTTFDFDREYPRGDKVKRQRYNSR